MGRSPVRPKEIAMQHPGVERVVFVLRTAEDQKTYRAALTAARAGGAA